MPKVHVVVEVPSVGPMPFAVPTLSAVDTAVAAVATAVATALAVPHLMMCGFAKSHQANVTLSVPVEEPSCQLVVLALEALAGNLLVHYRQLASA